MNENDFGKIIQDTSKQLSKDQHGKRIVWDSKSVAAAQDQVKKGYVLKHSPFLDGKEILYRKGGITFDYTAEERAEVKKCKRDILYFAETYIWLKTGNGYTNVKLRKYQRKMLLNFQRHRNNVVLSSRQIGKTTTTTIFLIWFLCFHTDKNVLFLANKGRTVKEIVRKAKKIYEFLPFFLKPGVNSITQSMIEFDNESRLVSDTTTKNASIGDTIDVIFVDEFAHIEDTVVDDFWENVLPTASASETSRVIITSTPNGRNSFYQLYKGAKSKKMWNGFHPMRVDWWEVPGHDEEWRESEIKKLGKGDYDKGVRAFNQQYACQFLSTQSLLLHEAELKRLDTIRKNYIHHQFEELDSMEVNYADLTWHPNFDLGELMHGHFVFSIDVAEGVGGDYSVLNIFQVVPKTSFKNVPKGENTEIYDFFKLKQVGIFRDNQTAVKDFSKLIYCVLVSLFNPDNYKVVLEWNTFGSDVHNRIMSFYGDDNRMDEECFVTYQHTSTAKIEKIGLKLRPDNKTPICNRFKDYCENDTVEINEDNSVEEAFGFGRDKKGNYKAQLENDDNIMSAINASTIIEKPDFKNLVEDSFDRLDQRVREDILSHIDRKSDSDFDEYDVLIDDDPYNLYLKDDVSDLFDDDDDTPAPSKKQSSKKRGDGLPNLFKRYDDDDDDDF
jgi:hypothetical protein